MFHAYILLYYITVSSSSVRGPVEPMILLMQWATKYRTRSWFDRGTWLITLQGRAFRSNDDSSTVDDKVQNLTWSTNI